MIALRWLQFRHWLASKIIGYNIHDAIDEAYDQGTRWGQMQTLKNMRNAPTV